ELRGRHPASLSADGPDRTRARFRAARGRHGRRGHPGREGRRHRNRHGERGSGQPALSGRDRHRRQALTPRERGVAVRTDRLIATLFRIRSWQTVRRSTATAFWEERMSLFKSTAAVVLALGTVLAMPALAQKK